MNLADAAVAALGFGVGTRVLTGPGTEGSQRGLVTVARKPDGDRPVLLVLGIGKAPVAMAEMSTREAECLRDILSSVINGGGRLPS